MSSDFVVGQDLVSSVENHIKIYQDLGLRVGFEHHGQVLALAPGQD